MGCDPYSHSRTQDYRNSNGAFYVYRKSDIGNPDQSEAFVVEYCARPATSNMFFEDVIKTCVFFGCEVLIENNRNNIMDYMEYREYMKYAMKVKGRKSPGIPTTQKTIEDIIAVTEAYIHNYLDRVYFSDLTLDWANFDPNNTTRFDRAMAAGMTLLANDRYKVYFKKKDIGRMYDVKELIR